MPQEQEKQTTEKPLDEKLRNLLIEMKDWERKPVLKVGKIVIELVKLPRRELKKRTEPEKLALHIRLEDSFKGIFIEDYRELEDLVTAVSEEKITEIAKILDTINRKRIIEYEL